MTTMFPLVPSALCVTLYNNGSQRSSFRVVKYDADKNYIEVMSNIMIRERQIICTVTFVEFVARKEVHMPAD